MSSSTSTVYYILGSTPEIYFLKESMGWYFLVPEVSCSDLSASRFLTTNSTNPDLILFIINVTAIQSPAI